MFGSKDSAVMRMEPHGRVGILSNWLHLCYFGLRLVCVVCIGLGSSVVHSQTIQTFQLEERFGVTHPTQVVDFDVTNTLDWSTSYLVAASGSYTKAEYIATMDEFRRLVAG